MRKTLKCRLFGHALPRLDGSWRVGDRAECLRDGCHERFVAVEVEVWVPAALSEVKADAWDEGYARGVRDSAWDMEPADNPYRQDGA